MTVSRAQPFSARTAIKKTRIEGEFPFPARTGLLHIVNEAVNANFVAGWHSVAQEARRIVRAPVQNYQANYVTAIKAAQEDTEKCLNDMSWERVFDFCERLHSQLAVEYSYQFNEETTVVTTKAQAQEFVAEELQRLFDEENFAYDFMNGRVERRGKRHTMGLADRAVTALADRKLEAARKHFLKAIGLFRDRRKPDYENAAKEAVCAVEAAAKELFPKAKAATLGDFIKWATTHDSKLLSKTIGQTFSGLYAFRNSAEGVSHGSASGGAVTPGITEYILGLAASQVLLLVDLMDEAEDPPF